MPDTLKEWAGRGAALALLAAGSTANAEYGLNFPPPATQGAREVYDIHMLTFYIATALMVVVTLIVTWSVLRHRKSRGVTADLNFHESWFGRWGWVSVPVLVLGVDLTIAGSAERSLERMWNIPPGKLMDIKVTGHQWWWEYDYLDHGVKLESRPLPIEKAGANYLRDVDEPLVVPVGTRIRFLHTSADVLHAFWVPELAFKKDAIPGYITETWAEIEKPGVFRGQCAELCGTWHSRMPIVVKAVAREEFDRFIDERRNAKAQAALEAAADREWTLVELSGRGEQIYTAKCVACHQAGGEGMPPAFPALKGSKVVLGPVEDHIKVILEGRPGTAMQAWNQLTDLEVAALVTYERNAWGNGTGDLVSPKRIHAARGSQSAAAR